MAQIYFPYVTLEEKEGLKVLHSDKLFIGESHIKDKHFLVYDDGTVPPWEMEPVLTAAILIMLDEINILREFAGMQPRTVQQLKDAIEARLNI